jgi:hypothetical protein
MMLRRPSTFAVAKSLIVLISYLPALHSRPTNGFQSFTHDDDGFPAEDPSSPAFWWKLGISVALVLIGGVFSGNAPHNYDLLIQD